MIRTTIPETKTMPPKLDDDSPTERMQLVAPASWMAMVEAWRRQQPKIPSKSEAVRILVERQIAQEKRDAKR